MGSLINCWVELQVKRAGQKYLTMANISDANLLIDPLCNNVQLYPYSYMRLNLGKRIEAYAEIFQERTLALIKVATCIYRDKIA